MVSSACEGLSPARALLYAEGQFAGPSSKLALSLLRYGSWDIIGVLDSTKAGRRSIEFWPHGKDVPIGATFDDFQALQPEVLIIGVAPRGGKLPEVWIDALLEAIRRKMHIANGLHQFLIEIPALRAAAEAQQVKLWDVRRHGRSYGVGMARAKQVGCKVLLTVGADCALGKMTAGLELEAALLRQGVRVAFLPTGQIGMLIKGSGVCIDSLVADFVAGAVEEEVLRLAPQCDLLIVEGQGSLFHPGYSAVTLGLLHGCMPEWLLFCEMPARTCFKDSDLPLPTIAQSMQSYLTMLAPHRKAEFVGIAVNPTGLSAVEKARHCEQRRAALGLPVFDPIGDTAMELAVVLAQRLR